VSLRLKNVNPIFTAENAEVAQRVSTSNRERKKVEPERTRPFALEPTVCERFPLENVTKLELSDTSPVYIANV